MPMQIKPFDLSELEDVASLADAARHTEYFVWGESNDLEILRLEYATPSKGLAQQQLAKWSRAYGEVFHLHKIVGKTAKPRDEEDPIAETCVNQACQW